MKKKYKIIVILVTFMSLVGVTLSILLTKTDLFKLKGAVSTNTSYYNWSQLTSVDNSYSYSSLVYTKNTRIYADYNYTETTDKYARYQTTQLTDGRATPFFRMNSTSDTASIIITNCWYDENGNLGHAVVTASPTDIWTDNGIVKFGLRKYEKTVGTQSNPTWDENGTIVNSRPVDYYEPIEFYLGSYRATASITLTYYKSLNITGDGAINTRMSTNDTAGKFVTTINYSGTKASNIQNVNSFYYDIDIAYTDSSISSKVFNGKEGVYPTSGITSIYYAKQGYAYSSPQLTAGTKTVTYQLSQNNNGVYIGTNSVYTEYSSGTYWMKYGISGIWYGTSAAFYTRGLSGTYTFNYSGADCNIGFVFFSPYAYSIESPVNKAPKVVYTGEEWKYELSQYIPNIYLNKDVNFGSIYSNLNNAGYITDFSFSEPVDSSKLTIKNTYTLTDSNENSLTQYIGLHSMGGTGVGTHTNGTSFTNFMSSSEAYNNIYKLTVPVEAETPTAEPYTVKSTGLATSKIGTGNSVTQNSNEVSTEVRSPRVKYDCSTNGGTGDTIVYQNVGENIDLTKTCTSTNEFLGWATTRTINNINEIITSKTMPIAEELHTACDTKTGEAKENCETTTLYGIYKKSIVINAKNETKMYDGTTLNASDGTTYGGGKCFTDNSLQSGHYISSCTYDENSNITNAGTREKVITAVRIIDGSNNDVTNLYDLSYVNGTLEITKRAIIVEAKEQQKHYDGTPLVATEDGEYKCTLANDSPNELVTGHELTCTSTGSRTEVGGEGENEKEITGVSIKLGTVDVKNNYDITQNNADLIVTSSLCPSASDYTGTYNGASHTITVGTTEGEIEYKESNSSTWSTTKPTRTDAGTTTVNIQVTDRTTGQVTTCPNRTIKINKRKVTYKADSDSKPYDGTPLTKPSASLISGTLVSGHIATFEISGSITNVGTEANVLNNVIIKQGNNDVTSNYTITKTNGTLEITPVDAECPSVTNYIGEYDGENHSITVTGGSGGTVQYRTSTTGTWTTSIPAQKNAGITIVYIRVNSDNNHNDKVCPNGTITINPKRVSFIAINQEKPYDGEALVAAETGEYKCQKSSGELVTGDTFSCISSGSITNVGTEVKNIDRVTIKDSNNSVVTDNYEIVTSPGELKVTPVDAVCPTITNYEGIYDGNSHTVRVTGGSGGTVKYRLVEALNNWSTELPTRIDAGTSEIVTKVEGDRNHNNVDCPPSRITINKREVTYKADSDSKPYDGTPLTKPSASLISGTLVSGHIATFEISGSITNVGTEANVLNNVIIKQGNNDVTSNYEITKENGVLEITSATTTCPTIISYEGEYDGIAHTITVGEVTGGTLEYRVSDEDNWSTELPTRTNAGTTEVQIRVKGDGNHDDEECAPKTIKINKKAIVVKTTNQEKPYDGRPLNATNDCSSEGLLENDSLVCTNDGSITNVGTKTKEIKRVTIKDINNVDVTENYNITRENGTLKVTPVDAECPSVTNYEEIYDGKSHTITASEITSGTIEYRINDQDEWSISKPTRRDVGTTIVQIKVHGDDNHNDKVCPNGTIKINKRPIVVKTTNEEKEYDGEPLVASPNTCSIKEGSTLGLNEVLDGCETSGSITNVGERDKTITTITIKDENDEEVDLNNYEITYEKGKLKVTGEFEPKIEKEVISTKSYYRFNDTVRYKITVRNPAIYGIRNVRVTENNINANFIEGNGYVLVNTNQVVIPSIRANSSVEINAEYKVGKTERNKVENEVEIVSAESEVGATLKEKEYKAIATFNIQSKIKVCKNISGVSIPNKFQFRVSGIENGYESYVVINKDECMEVYVDPGKYKVTEIIPEEYEIENVRGAITSNNGVINVIQGHDYEVTYTNKFTQKVYFHSYGRKENKVRGGE